MFGVWVAASMLDVDVTFFVQLGLFLVLLAVLRPLVFRPLVDLQRRRYQETLVREEQAGQWNREADAIGTRVECEVRDVRDQALRASKDRVSQARQSCREQVEAQRANAVEQLAQAVRQFEAELAVEEPEVDAAVDVLVTDVRHAILGELR
jgi:F0F1-type ATP synthase membrane subunit b/b'